MSTNITFECSLIVADLPQVDIGILGLDVMTKENIDLLISWKLFINTHNTTPTTSASSVSHGASGWVTLEEHAAASHSKSENFSLENTCLQIYCTKDFTLPARSETIISAKLGKVCKNLKANLGGKKVMAEPDNTRTRIKTHGVYAARVLSKVTNNGVITKVLSCSEEEIILKRR